MKKITLSLFLISIIGSFVFYSCSTDDDNMSISERINKFCSDYNSKNDNIRYNFLPGSSEYNSDISNWNSFFGGAPSNHVAISYTIISEGTVSIVNITCDKYPSGHPYTFTMVKSGDNYLISSISG